VELRTVIARAGVAGNDMQRRGWSAWIFVLAVAAMPARALEARVVRVLDGDSLIASVDGREVELRLADVDAPEHGQAYGEQAKRALSDLVRGRIVTIDVRKRDQYGRWVVDVALAGRAIDHALVEAGHVWVYRKYNRERRLVELEDGARAARRGLWAQPQGDIEPPWEWRHAAHEEPTPGAATGVVLANRRSHIYHLPNCPGYGTVSERNRVYFDSERAAVAAGYRRARNCG
jgi:endonuclease YncB( thermonuclease family)